MMIDALATALWREVLRLDGVERHLWRRFFLRKSIHVVPEALRPVPDGLSSEYVKIGRRFNEKLFSARLQTDIDAFSPFLGVANAILEDEISLALLNEQELLAIATAR